MKARVRKILFLISAIDGAPEALNTCSLKLEEWGVSK